MAYGQPPWGERPIEVVTAERGRCPVCGHPTGDCVGESHFSRMVEFAPPKKPDPAATFIVQRRVYTEEQVGARTVRRLLYAVGDRIRVEEAKKVGLIQ